MSRVQTIKKKKKLLTPSQKGKKSQSKGPDKRRDPIKFPRIKPDPTRRKDPIKSKFKGPKKPIKKLPSGKGIYR